VGGHYDAPVATARAALARLLATTLLAGLAPTASGAVVSGAAAPPAKNGKIAFVRDGHLWVVGANGGDLARLPGPAGVSHPAWSPDGERIAYARRLAIYVAAADGSGATDISAASLAQRPSDVGPAASCDGDPAWSPDGSWIVFTSTVDDCTGAAGGLYAMRPDGSGWRVVEEDYEGLLGGDTEPAWGPGGRRIAFTRSDSLRMASGPYVHDVLVLSASTGKVVRSLTRSGDSHSPAWSPDGKRIAFVHAGHVAVMSATGRGVHDLVRGSAPAWSPDGSWIAFAGTKGLERIRPDGTGRRLLVAGGCAQPAWQALG
jgi:TolB protein